VSATDRTVPRRRASVASPDQATVTARGGPASLPAELAD